MVIPSVARNLVVSTTERLEKQILRFAQDDNGSVAIPAVPFVIPNYPSCHP